MASTRRRLLQLVHLLSPLAGMSLRTMRDSSSALSLYLSLKEGPGEGGGAAQQDQLHRCFVLILPPPRNPICAGCLLTPGGG